MRRGMDRPAAGWAAQEVSRRGFLKAGTVTLGTLACGLPASAGPLGNGKSLIHIYLPGGPSHLETFDMKPASPAHQRGEFRPIRTKAAGVEICELLPKLARLSDRFTVVRGITGLRDEHSPSLCDCGWPADSLRDIGGRPGMTAVLSRLQGSSSLGTASGTSVDLTGWTKAGFLQDQAAIFEPVELASAKQKSHRQRLKASALTAHKSQPSGLVLRNRTNRFNRERIQESSAVLDWGLESARTLHRYGVASCKENARFLQARRLVENGVRCVSFEWGYWDTHGNNFGQLRNLLPALDQGLSALMEDLDSNGRLEETLILMSGEFGRTPEINDGAGRDHWPDASCAILAGGGLPHGRVIGRTDREGRFPQDPVPMQSVIAAAYAALGIDAAQIRLSDPQGHRHALLIHTTLSSALC
jgi:uncharacterized protein (DUF1501 family)